MATCVKVLSDGKGGPFLALDPSVSNVSTCAYVLQSGAEVGNSILSMSAEDGALLSAGIVSVWAMAFAIRSIVNIVRGSSE